ncbi:MAG: gamma-glutamyl-gamma-aminobutyrate hydrolase family protein [Proteobacteria bacterium]|nr:gamma-glutamyl-gamma-aminobutyrate hydrolase family protein [Pseudomonadota bacterium]
MKPRIGITMSYGKSKDGEFFSLKVLYVRLVEHYGGLPFLIFPTQDKELLREYARMIDGLILSGGRDIPPSYYGEKVQYKVDLLNRLRPQSEIGLLKEFIPTRKPVLGICYGAQLMNVMCGGTLYQDIPSQILKAARHEEVRHSITVYEDTRLFKLVRESSLEVNSHHHQAVKKLGKGLTCSALALDGIIEAIESKDHPFFIGVQWHPEREPEDPFTGRIMKGFIRACKAT